MDIDPQQIRTEADWKRSKSWLEKNAQYIDEDIREGIVDCLFDKAAELGYEPLISEKSTLLKIAGRNPITEEVHQLTVDSLHKLASGKYYTTGQFEVLPFEEVQALLPELVKKASFEMPLLHPRLFAKAAETEDRTVAVLLDALLQKYGQFPVMDEADLPMEVNDAMLAKL